MKTFKKILNKKVLTPEELAKKHGVSKEHILSQLNDGIKVEHEHSSNAKVAKQIALAHLGETPDYYKKLKKVEKNPIKEERNIKMNNILLESRIKKIMGMFSKRQSKYDRIEHARHAYKIVNDASTRLKKQLEGAHPDVKQILDYIERHHTSALNMLNKMGAGENPMKPKKSKEREIM